MNSAAQLKRILIVEDEPIVGLDLQAMLEPMGYAVMAIVPTADEAYRAALAGSPDLILMDVRLKEGSDGVDAARRIRRELDAPIIYITATADDATVDRARDTMPYGYLIKPITERDLVTNVDSAITRHAMERALRESEERFRTIFEAANDSIIIHDIDTGGIVDANRRAIEFYGGEDLNALWSDDRWADPPYSAADALRWIRRAADEGPQTFEWKYLHHSGECFWEEVSLTKIRYGGAERVLAVSRNITERKRMEAALRESEQLYRTLVDTSPDAIIMSDLAGNILFANMQAARLLGYGSVEEYILGMKNVFMPIAPDDRARAIENAQRTLETGAVSGIEYTILRRNGEAFPAELSASLVYDADHRPRGFIAVVRDISERKRAEESLREMMGELRAIYDSQHDGIYVVDSETRRFMRVNSSLCEHFGYSAAEFCSLIVEDVHPPDALPRVREEFAMLRDGLKDIAPAIPCLRKDGSVFFADIAARRFVFHGRPALTGSFRDITERIRAEDEKRRLEEQLRQAQKMESIGRLAGGVAHDFNNLLTVIMGNVSLALMDLNASNPLHKTLDVVMRAVESAASLTRQLLAFSRKQIIEPRSINMNELVRDIRDILGRVAGDAARLELRLAPESGFVQADRGQMEQMIINLVSNARDAMPEGGTIRIETADVDLDAEYCRRHPEATPGRHVVLSVTDTGIGMSPEILANIFEPFFTTKPHGKGTGLGLSTVYGAVKQNGGSIEVDSAKGRGTTFRIFLPRLAEPQLGPIAPQTEQDLPTGSETIMLVEDEPVVRDLTLNLLMRQGYRVLHYAGAGEALIALEGYADPIHLLLTDIIMPGLNGRELARIVLEKRPETKVLLISGYSGSSSLAGDIHEAFNFLPKPYTPSVLARKIREILDSNP